MMAENVTLDVLVDDDRWHEVGCDHIAQVSCENVVEEMSLEGDLVVSFRFTSDAEMQILNRDFRQKDRATNVLSWPSDERGASVDGEIPSPPTPDFTGEIELGDIALGFETCQHEALDAGISFENHVTHLCIHGVLHLLGYDHIRDKDATLMERAEIRILEKLVIPNPYETE